MSGYKVTLWVEVDEDTGAPLDMDYVIVVEEHLGVYVSDYSVEEL